MPTLDAKRGVLRTITVFVRSFGLRGESSFLVQNLSVLIGAGLDIQSALTSVLAEVRSVRMRSALREALTYVEDGMSLSDALQRVGVVTPHTYTLIRMGELSGTLVPNLEVAALQNEKETMFRSRVRSALMYSTFVLLTAIAVGVGVAWYILPRLAEYFSEAHATLPAITRSIIVLGLFLKEYGYVFIPAFLGVVMAMLYFLFSFPKTRFIGHSILFHTPLIHNLILETEMARFGFLSGTMIRAGIPVQTVFALLPGTTTFSNYRRMYTYIAHRISDGASFRVMFSGKDRVGRLLPHPVRQMLIAAERSGTLDETLLKIGTLYEGKVDVTSRNIPAFLEPLLLLLIGLLVALLALGVIMPVYQFGLYL
jgi:type II secretory pathway component PulF